MKTEIKILIYSMINNFVIALMKIFGGITFQLSSLIADGMHTLSDFITDIVSLIGSKISKKRPTKYHPFGFGKVEYLTNLFVGVMLLVLGLYIIVSSFFKKTIIPPLETLILLAIVFILKLILIIVMDKVGKKINSHVLITSVKESVADLYSTIAVMLITIILQYSNHYPILKYSDLIGSIIIGLIVLKTSFTIILCNSLSLIGEVDNNEDVINKITEYLKQFDKIQNSKIELVKYGSYYKLQLTLDLNSNLSLRKVINLESKIKKYLLHNKALHIKYLTIYITNNIKS